jgi:elongation factor P--(R)-beta-lysine ligase
MSAESKSTRSKLIERAEALASARYFFKKRSIIEVDPILLSQNASIDTHIDLFSAHSTSHEKRFLFSSPEYPMKRLLSKQSGDIFYLGHVWRDEPAGHRHSPEFLLAEWYRIGFSFQQMIEETILFAEEFIGKRAHFFISYKDAFLQNTPLDPFLCSTDDLRKYCSLIPSLSSYPLHSSSKDDLLTLILNTSIEPFFPKEAITVLFHYPPSQASLAQVTQENVAERFELYAEGIELANGYHELADSQEQKKRFISDNDSRVSLGKEKYPIDEKFLSSIISLPDCSGVAVGVDRLLLIKNKVLDIHELYPISWNES